VFDRGEAFLAPSSTVQRTCSSRVLNRETFLPSLLEGSLSALAPDLSEGFLTSDLDSPLQISREGLLSSPMSSFLLYTFFFNQETSPEGLGDLNHAAYPVLGSLPYLFSPCSSSLVLFWSRLIPFSSREFLHHFPSP